MKKKKQEHPYFEAWLSRVRKQLHASGQLSQVAVILARENGGTADEWRGQLRTLIDGRTSPTFELVTRLESILSASPTVETTQKSSQLPLI